MKKERTEERGGSWPAEGIKPSAEAIRKVEAEHPHKSPGEKHRLAQAQTLLDEFGAGSQDEK